MERENKQGQSDASGSIVELNVFEREKKKVTMTKSGEISGLGPPLKK